MLGYMFSSLFTQHKVANGQIFTTSLQKDKSKSVHVHSYIWIFNAPIILDEKVNIVFFGNLLNAHLPEPENEPDHFDYLELIRFIFIQDLADSRTCWKYNKNECDMGVVSVIKQC